MPPTDDLHTLTYASRRVPTRAVQEQRRRLEQVVALSRERNARLDVSGLLLVGAVCFAQRLEGPRRAVLELFEDRIRPDPLHDGVLVLVSEPLGRRAFAEWSMAAVDVPAGLVDEYFARHGTLGEAGLGGGGGGGDARPPCGSLLSEVEHIVERIGRPIVDNFFGGAFETGPARLRASF